MFFVVVVVVGTLFLITSSVIPAILPPLLPQGTIKLLLAQFDIDHIMCLTHPIAQLVSSGHSGLVARLDHPCPEIIGAHPTRVQLGKCGDELFHDRLGGRRGFGRVLGGHGVE